MTHRVDNGPKGFISSGVYSGASIYLVGGGAKMLLSREKQHALNMGKAQSCNKIDWLLSSSASSR